MKMDEAKRMNAKLSKKIKTAVSDEMSGVNKILEEKDHEITVLKDMVRSTQYQMRTIEADTHDIKRKLNNKSISPRRTNESKDPISPIYTAINHFLTGLGELNRWFNKKSKSMRTSTDKMMTADEASDLLGFPILSESEVDIA